MKIKLLKGFLIQNIVGIEVKFKYKLAMWKQGLALIDRHLSIMSSSRLSEDKVRGFLIVFE